MKMPKDWNNHSGWDRYFEANPVDLKDIKKYSIRDNLRYLDSVKDKRVWISGCGLELSPWLYSNFNCEVLATDVSKVAIDFQLDLLKHSPFESLNDLDSVLEELKIEPKKNFISPKIRVEDFRKTSPNEKFDVILNTKAIQGLPKEDIAKAAQVFFNSNVDGGVFIASTMNVQGMRRTEIENSFLDAGYIIPNVKAEQWYRQKLEETGIVYAMVLGNPIIPQWSQYENKGGKEKEEQDKLVLKSFREEYTKRLKQNYEEYKEFYNPEIHKLAYIIYNTG